MQATTVTTMAAKPTLVLMMGADPFQLLVSLVTFNPASHSAIGVGDHLLHATDQGVVFEPREAYFKRKRQKVVGEFEIVPDVSEGLARCFACIGEPYDIARILQLTLWLSLRRLASPLKGLAAANKRKHTCSSFVMLLDPTGERIFEWRNLDRDAVTPSDLFMTVGRSFRQCR